MHKKIIAMCLCLGLFLSGCQLAQPEETKTTQGETLESPVQMERLAGVYLTLEPIVLEAGTDRIQARRCPGRIAVMPSPGWRDCCWVPSGFLRERDFGAWSAPGA